MQRELHTLWRALRRHDPVRAIVLTGAGEKAFCTGIDRMEQMGGESDDTTEGEVEFIVAAESATFFDPHVTYGMTAAFEPIHMAGITPFCEIMRLSLLGNYERMSAQRAYQIGMVTEVVPAGDLAARAHEVAAIIASQPKLAIEGTVRAIWSTRTM